MTLANRVIASRIRYGEWGSARSRSALASTGSQRRHRSQLPLLIRGETSDSGSFCFALVTPSISGTNESLPIVVFVL